MSIELTLAICGILLTIIFGILGLVIAKNIRSKNSNNKKNITQNKNTVINGDIVGGNKNVRSNNSK